ncbi:MAG: DUF1501 domain-containing protein [Pseudomonadota bacterium]
MEPSRRALLQTLAGLGGAALLPGAWAKGSSRRLVLIELNGGNDPLNAFPPHRDPLYRKYRPSVGVPDGDIIKLMPQIGWHPALRALLPAWEAGEVALVQGTGYSDPVLSHFESARIWETGQRDTRQDSGWMTQALAQRRAPDPAAVIFGFSRGPLRSYRHGVLQLHNLSSLGSDSVQLAAQANTEALRYLLEIHTQSQALAQYRSALEKLPPLTPLQQKSRPLMTTLRCVGALMTQPQAPVIYKLIHGGFDTHIGQVEAQGRQLDRLAEALAYFRVLMTQLGLWNDVLIITYSEFGRRVAENASGGTDHGAAQTQLLMGRGVAPGLHGTVPDLAALDADGNLRHQIDFRTVYNQVCTLWLGWDRPFALDDSSIRFLRA